MLVREFGVVGRSGGAAGKAVAMRWSEGPGRKGVRCGRPLSDIGYFECVQAMRTPL